jgi:hypothetical protein
MLMFAAISKNVVPMHILEILKAKIKQGEWTVRVGLPDNETAQDRERINVGEARSAWNTATAAGASIREARKSALTKKRTVHSSLSLAALGAIHEFGTSRIPPRPFLATGVAVGRDRIREVSKAALLGIVRGKRSIAEGLAFVGMAAVASIQKVIADGGYFIALSQQTIDQKGSSKPLIDTGQLRQSITYVVTSKAGTANV